MPPLAAFAFPFLVILIVSLAIYVMMQTIFAKPMQGEDE